MTDARLLSRSQPPKRYAGIERVQFPGNPGATNALSQIDETLRRFFGTRGPFLERAVTWGELVNSGLAVVNVPSNGGGVPGDPVVEPPPTGTAEEDTRTPPAPTGLTAVGAQLTIILEWDAPGFSYFGHTEVWRADTDNLAVAVHIGETQSVLYADAVGSSGVTYYYWVRHVSKAGKPGPFNAVTGTAATTAPIVEDLLAQLAGQLSESQLSAALNSRIDQIEVLQSQMLLLSAGVGEQFDPWKIWYFDTGTDAWSGNGTPTATGGWIKPADHATDAWLASPTGVAAVAATYPQVKLRIRKVGAPVWEGYVYWAGASQAWDAGRREAFAEPAYDANGIAVVTVTVPWSGTIDAIRFDLSAASSATDYYEIDWVAIGRASPGASVASVTAEQAARTSADSALAGQITTLSAAVSDGDATLGAAIQAEETARVNADNATAAQIITLNAAINDNTAAIQQEALVRADETGALFGRYTVKIDLNGYVVGYGLASTENDGATVGEFQVRADRFYIASPSGPGIAPTNPFTVLTTPQTVNGITLDPGVYMTAAYAKKAILDTFVAGLAVIDDASIVNLKASKILGDTLGVGQWLASTNYIAGASGWRINANGSAEFSGVIVRGTVYASAGLIGGTVIGANYLQSAGYAAGSSGYRLNQDGSAEFYNLTARGNIQAQTLAAGASIQSPAIFGGSYTAAYAWPASGGGFHLSSSGLLLGNGNTGSYFQVTSAGNVYAPGFSIVGGAMTVSALNVIGTGQVVNESITVPRSGYSAGPSDATNRTITPVSLSALSGPPSYALIGSLTIYVSGDNADHLPASVTVRLLRDGSEVASSGALTLYAQSIIVPVNWRDTSSPGGTYSIQVTSVNPMNATTVSRAFLLALGTKR